MPGFLYQILNLLPLTFFPPSASLIQVLAVSLRQQLRHRGRTQSPAIPSPPRPCTCRSSVPRASGLCASHLPGKLPSHGAPGRPGARRRRRVLDRPADSAPSLPEWAWRCRSAHILALPSCPPGTEALCRTLWGSGWEVSLFTSPPALPWHKAERSLRLINPLPSLLLRPIFYSWTRGILHFTRTRASIFYSGFTCQLPAPSFLFPTGSRTLKAGHAGLAQGGITDAPAASQAP